MQQPIEQVIPDTLGGAAAAVATMSREVGYTFLPLDTALISAYSALNNLQLSESKEAGFSALTGAVVGGAVQAGGAFNDTLSAKDYYDANKQIKALDKEYIGDYDPSINDHNKQQSGKIKLIDDQLKTKNGHSVTKGPNGQNIPATQLSEDDLKNERSRLEKEHESKKSHINNDLQAKTQNRQMVSRLTQAGSQIANAAGNSAQQIFKANADVVGSVANQLMQTLNAMQGTVNQIMANNPAGAFEAFAR